MTTLDHGLSRNWCLSRTGDSMFHTRSYCSCFSTRSRAAYPALQRQTASNGVSPHGDLDLPHSLLLSSDSVKSSLCTSPVLTLLPIANRYIHRRPFAPWKTPKRANIQNNIRVQLYFQLTLNTCWRMGRPSQTRRASIHSYSSAHRKIRVFTRACLRSTGRPWFWVSMQLLYIHRQER